MLIARGRLGLAVVCNCVKNFADPPNEIISFFLYQSTQMCHSAVTELLQEYTFFCSGISVWLCLSILNVSLVYNVYEMQLHFDHLRFLSFLKSFKFTRHVNVSNSVQIQCVERDYVQLAQRRYSAELSIFQKKTDGPKFCCFFV